MPKLEEVCGARDGMFQLIWPTRTTRILSKTQTPIKNLVSRFQNNCNIAQPDGTLSPVFKEMEAESADLVFPPQNLDWRQSQLRGIAGVIKVGECAIVFKSSKLIVIQVNRLPST